MAIKGATFDLQTVLAKYDGAMYSALSNGHDGYVSWNGGGQPISITDTNVMTLKSGYILVHGRLVVIDGNTDITLSPGSSISSGDGRLVLKIDTTVNNTQGQLNQVSILEEYKASGSSWRTLTTTDINIVAGVYEVQLCHFTVTNGTSSSAVVDISTDTLIGDLQADIETLADSVEATGDAVGTLQTGKANAGMGNYNGNLNDLKTAGWYFVASGVTNAPATATAIVEVVTTTNNNAGGILQRWVAISTGIRYQRQWTSTLDWTSWVKEVNSVVPIADGGTGASTLNSAQTNLGIFTGLGTIIPSGSDLNNYTTIGIYSVNSWNSAQNISNIPEKNAGKLVVFNTIGTDTTALGQLYITHGQNHVYYRNRAASTWNSEWGLIGAPDIVKVTYTNEALTGSTPKQLKVSSSEVLNGATFGTLTANRTYITLPAGTYRINTNFKTSPGSNGSIKSCLKIGSASTVFILTDQFYAGAGCGTGGGATVMGINATDVIKLTASTNIYFLVMSWNDTDGCAGSLTIERLG